MSREVVSVRGVTKQFGDVIALDDVSFDIGAHTIYGLLGRNGAGKTTIMKILAGHVRQTCGRVEVFGETPFENRAVLDRLCFVSEGQCYPDDLTVSQVLATAATLFPNWDNTFASQVVEEFGLPVDRRMKKLSRGMRSAVGVVIGLASRAPLTVFDEPYLGLDAASRALFYNRLLADYAEKPRTVVLSTHLIDEVSDLIERVLVIDQGRLVIDDDADALRASAVVVSGPSRTVDAFATGRTVLHRESLGGQARTTVTAVTDGDRAKALGVGLDLQPLSLQQLIVNSTTQTKETVR